MLKDEEEQDPLHQTAAECDVPASLPAVSLYSDMDMKPPPLIHLLH